MSEINLPLDIESLETTGQSVDNKGNIILDVVSKNAHRTCYGAVNPLQNVMVQRPQVDSSPANIR